MKKGIIFSDVDGTLCFHQQLHGVEPISSGSDGTILVHDSKSGTDHFSYDISTDIYKVFIGLETQRLCHQLREDYHFILVTGGRPSTVLGRRAQFTFADAVILENGGVIFDEDYEPDREWEAMLAPERAYLSEVKSLLESAGWVLDVKGRTAALRVRKKDNPNKSDQEYLSLCESIDLPEELKKTSNIGNLDVILRSAGKGNAVRYLMEKLGYEKQQSVGIGDDINDIDLLEATGDKYVLGSSYPEAIQIAKDKGWYISKGLHFDGIDEVLNRISAR